MYSAVAESQALCMSHLTEVTLRASQAEHSPQPQAAARGSGAVREQRLEEKTPRENLLWLHKESCYLFLGHSVVISEPKHCLLCQFPFFLRRQALCLRYYICAPSQVSCSDPNGSELGGETELPFLPPWRLKRYKEWDGADGAAARDQMLVSGLSEKKKARSSLGTCDCRKQQRRGIHWEQRSHPGLCSQGKGWIPAQGRCGER